LTQVNNDKDKLDMRLGTLIHFCSVKGFYCGRAKRTARATNMCSDCPAEPEEKVVEKAKKTCSNYTPTYDT